MVLSATPGATARNLWLMSDFPLEEFCKKWGRAFHRDNLSFEVKLPRPGRYRGRRVSHIQTSGYSGRAICGHNIFPALARGTQLVTLVTFSIAVVQCW